MAGLTELVSPYLKAKLERARDLGDDATVRVLTLQYSQDAREAHVQDGERERHYVASVSVGPSSKLHGVERLYRHAIVVLTTTVCAAHCRWCLRARYEPFNASDDELLEMARYCGREEELREILISGGDPLMAPRRLARLLDFIEVHAPNIAVARIASRVPLHDPDRVDAELLGILSGRRVRVELGIHINHSAELFPEVKAALTRVAAAGVTIYNQSVLLRGLNDDATTLVALFDTLRAMRIEPHYVFHPVPMMGMAHHRMSVARGLTVMDGVVNSGRISGRAKPRFAAMTDVGKVVLQHGAIEATNGRQLLLRTAYSYADRRRWNPQWQLPASAFVDADGLMKVWYTDGEDG